MPASVVDMSTGGLAGLAASCGLAWLRAAAGVGSMAGSGWARARGAEGVRRHRADVVPAHPVAAEHRALDAGANHAGRPSSPTTGSTHVMQTPMPQAIDSSTAHWLGTP